MDNDKVQLATHMLLEEEDAREVISTNLSRTPSTLFQSSVPLVFKKTVYVVNSKAKTSLTLVQRKVSNAWINHAIHNPPDEDGFWHIPIGVIKKEIEYTSENYKDLRSRLRDLMHIILEWDVIANETERVGWKADVLFPSVRADSKMISFTILPHIYKELKKPEVYAEIDMAIVRRFRLPAALAIWEFCIRYKRIHKTAQIPWQEFRDFILGDSAKDKKTLQEYKYFKKRVLGPALAEINSESEHTVKLIEYMAGQRVMKIQFDIYDKQEPQALNVDAPIELIGRMVHLGMPQADAVKICERNDHDRIRKALEYTETRLNDGRRKPVELPVAYFKKTLVNRYGSEKEKFQAVAEVPKENTVDLRAEYLKEQVEEAKRYYKEINSTQRKEHVESYNEQTTAPQFKIKQRITKASEYLFYKWLAQTLWGEPTETDLLAFAASFATKLLQQKKTS